MAQSLPPQTPQREVAHGSGSPQTYGILKYVVNSFGLDSVLLANGSNLDPSHEIWESRGITWISCRPKRNPTFLLIIVRYFYLQQKYINILFSSVPNFISLFAGSQTLNEINGKKNTYIYFYLACQNRYLYFKIPFLLHYDKTITVLILHVFLLRKLAIPGLMKR